MSESKRLFETARRLIPGGVNSPVRAYDPYPFFTKSAAGCRLTDVDDREYIDYCLGYGPLILGHSPAPVMEAVKDQLNLGTLYGTPSPQEVEFAELICECVPSAEMVRLVTTGAEATMSAIRVARGFTEKKKILKFEGCYHGAHDSVLVKAGSGAATFGMPDSLGVPEETAKNTIVAPFNDVEAFEAALKKEKNKLAAVIVEPVIGNIGVVLPKEGYLETLRELTQEYGVILIFDEVITGFRLALGGAQEYYGVQPDLATFGKILGGGFPLAAYAGREDIMRLISPSGRVYQAGTFSGNPVSVAAGLATLKTLRGRKSFYAELEKKCERLTKRLLGLSDQSKIPVRVNHAGSMFQMFLTEKPVYDCASAKLSDGKKFMKLHKTLLDNGVFVPPSQFETCFLSSAHTMKDVDLTVQGFESAFEAL